MARLTKQVKDGYFVLNCDACEMKGENCTPMGCLQVATKRLADYEETLLEPKEVAGLCAMDKRRHMAKMLRWEEAEQDGSLVVLPCKVGDMVYEVCNNTDACSGCRNYEGIYGSGESWCTRIDDVDLRSYPDIAERPLCEKQFMEVVEHKPKADWIFNHRNDFGKTVFLTREEAEAALKEADNA